MIIGALRMMRAVTLVVAVFLMGDIPSGSAGCGVNFEKMKTRRIEAIRGQILSKLGLTQLPKDDRPPGQIPRDVEAMYNRTKDFVEEQARVKRQECEENDVDYFAQEVVTVFAKEGTLEQGNDQVTDYKNNKLTRQTSEFFEFDLMPMKLDATSVTSATLRFYQIPNRGSASSAFQQVDLHQLTLPSKVGHSPGRHFLNMRLMDTLGSGWQSFDVTNTIREWVRYSHTNLGLELTVPCPEDDQQRSHTRRSSSRGVRERLEVLFAGSTRTMADGRGDDARQPDVLSVTTTTARDLFPHLIIMTRSQHEQQQSSSRRRAKRSLDAEYCFKNNPNEPNCCLRKLYIDFRRDLKWTWIHAPSGYYANFCAGACPYLWSMDSQHATILSLYKTMNPKASSSPCCVPKQLDPLTIMFYNKGRYQVKRLSDMVLLSCKCS